MTSSGHTTPAGTPPSPAVPARNLSPWTRREKIARLAWSIVYHLLFRCTFHNWYGIRAALVRAFGGRLGRNVRLRRTVRIEIPWNLDLADDVSVGDEVILYSLGPIRIGARTFISQYAHLCAGTHDHTRGDYPLLRLPITVGQDCWIAADAFVGPGVTIGDRTVLGARASAFSDLPADVIAVGNPARPIKPRPFTPVDRLS
ncbi:MAG TPA: hypothetical protein VNL70_04945 [Tepidisphaeraceae bacterium]|nr:hypothetical protein [Tepidisphaeraceae bacterium]